MSYWQTPIVPACLGVAIMQHPTVIRLSWVFCDCRDKWQPGIIETREVFGSARETSLCAGQSIRGVIP